jgi:hypothetical protein
MMNRIGAHRALAIQIPATRRSAIGVKTVAARRTRERRRPAARGARNGGSAAAPANRPATEVTSAASEVRATAMEAAGSPAGKMTSSAAQARATEMRSAATVPAAAEVCATTAVAAATPATTAAAMRPCREGGACERDRQRNDRQ